MTQSIHQKPKHSNQLNRTLSDTIIRCGISPAFYNKSIRSGYTQSAFGNSFQPTAIPIPNLIDHFTAGNGYTLACFNSLKRTKETFKDAQLLGLDLDDNVSVQDCLDNRFIANNAFFIGATASSGKPDKDGNVIYKTRVLFMTDTPITSVAQFERSQRTLQLHCADLRPDPACNDASRMFYGSDTSDFVTMDNVLSLATMEAIATQWQDVLDDRQPRTEDENTQIQEYNRQALSDITDTRKKRNLKYARVALDNLARDLTSTTKGGRNTALYKHGAKMGNFVGAGMIDRLEVETSLHNAGLSCGLSQSRIKQTLPHAISDGENTPFDLSKLTDLSPIKNRLHASNLDAMPADDSQIPDSLRKLAIKYAKTSEAVLIEYLNTAIHRNLINADNFTVKDAIKALHTVGCKLSESTIRQTLQAKTNVVCQKLDTIEPTVSNFRQLPQNEAKDTVNSDDKSGRCANSPLVSNFRQLPQNEVIKRLLLRAKYRIYEDAFDKSDALSIFTESMFQTVNLDNETLIELNHALESIYQSQASAHYHLMAKIKAKYTQLELSLEDKYSTPLPDWTITKPAQYKPLFVRAIIEANKNADSFTRRELCDMAGISNGSLTTVLNNAGIKNKTTELRIPVTSSLSAMIEAKTNRAYIKWIAITDSEGIGTTHLSFNKDTADSIIKDAIAQGCDVRAVLQPPAQQHIITDSQPQPQPKPHKQPSMRVSKPKSNTRKAGYHFEASCDPQFTYWELAKAVKLVKGYTFRDDILHDTNTGEIFAVNPTARELVDILLDRVPTEFGSDEMTDDDCIEMAGELGGILESDEPRSLRTHQEQLFEMHTVNM